MIRRAPGPALRPFVKVLWASDATDDAARTGIARERVLPTGGMHVVLRISEPLRIFDGPEDAIGRVVGPAIIGGARSSAYVRDISRAAISVGAQLHPGVSSMVLGVPAGELSERHTSLEDVWGPAAREALERVAEASTAERRLELFEAILTARLPRVRSVHPAVAAALARYASAPDVEVREVAREAGYSDRRFLDVFRDAIGLTPKVYSRVLRFQHALARLRSPRARAIEVALDAGYSDQPHFNREFRAIAGVSPGRYLDLAPLDVNHVPIAPRR